MHINLVQQLDRINMWVYWHVFFKTSLTALHRQQLEVQAVTRAGAQLHYSHQHQKSRTMRN